MTDPEKRIVVFGATGYTGRLTVAALLRRGQRPVLAGRDSTALAELAQRVPGPPLPTAVADVENPDSVAALIDSGDVLLSTVGPFGRCGAAAAQAAIGRGAHYLDSNGEPAFTRQVFQRYGPTAERAGIVMLTAFGWECVLGNLVGALALRDAGPAAIRVDTGYFYIGKVGFSGGTRASFFDAMIEPSFAYRNAGLLTVRGAERLRTMPVGERVRPGLSFGASEHFALPRTFPQLLEVNAYQGWLGRLPTPVVRVLHAGSGPGFAALRVPGIRRLYGQARARLVSGATGGPSATERARGGVHVVATAYDRHGAAVAEVHLTGIEGYELTAEILAWGAEQLVAGRAQGAGALGPVEAFGLAELQLGCREAGANV